MSISINKLTNCNIYVNGSSLLGKAESVDLPDVQYKTVDHSGLGMVGVIEHVTGIDKLSCKIKWNSLYPDAVKSTSNPFKKVSLQVRGSLEIYEGGERVREDSVIVYLTVNTKKLSLPNFKAQDNVEMESEFSVSAFKLEVAGEVLTDVDIEANILFVNGEDLLATYRKNLGI